MRLEEGVRRLGNTPETVIRQALAKNGLWIDVGLVTVRLRSDVSAMAAQLASVYRHFPFLAGPQWADLHVDLMRPMGLRSLVRPQVRFSSERETPFEPFPEDTALPLFEWGANWLISRRMNNVLLFHAGVLEKEGLALVLPAVPGSGKSTLTSALSLRGWRLLSDEFGAFDPGLRAFRPVLKPAALKNDSIEVIRQWSADAPLGPEFPKTRKGTVAHLAPSLAAVDAVHEFAQPGAIVLPKWQAGAATQWSPVPASEAFAELAFNAFNYNVMGQAGFHAVVHLVRRCPAWRLVYSNLDEALTTLSDAWPQVLAEAPQRREAAEAAVSADLR